jgi:hypothetical protein
MKNAKRTAKVSLPKLDACDFDWEINIAGDMVPLSHADRLAVSRGDVGP